MCGLVRDLVSDSGSEIVQEDFSVPRLADKAEWVAKDSTLNFQPQSSKVRNCAELAKHVGIPRPIFEFVVLHPEKCVRARDLLR